MEEIIKARGGGGGWGGFWLSPDLLLVGGGEGRDSFCRAVGHK